MNPEKIFRKLLLIRRAEDRIIDHYFEDEMKTPMHMSRGAEAIHAGICSALDTQDPVMATYRSHGPYLAKTENTDNFFLELFGKQQAICQGRGGSMHLFDKDRYFFGTSAIVASGIPVSLGVAWSLKHQNQSNIVTIFFGDGAVDEGVFFESVNFASLHGLPILFVYEDNGYAVHQDKSARQGYSDITDLMSSYKIGVFETQSTDADDIYNLTKKVRQSILNQNQPGFLKCSYYRYLEHVGVRSDFSAGYRSESEFKIWFKKDPVDVYTQKLIAQNTLDIDAIDQAVTQQVDQSFAKARQDDFAPTTSLKTHLFA